MQNLNHNDNVSPQKLNNKVNFCGHADTFSLFQAPLKYHDMLKMLAEIMGISDKVEFTNEQYIGHYIRTPYAYKNKVGRKYIMPFHVDLGQGLVQLLNEIQPKIFF